MWLSKQFIELAGGIYALNCYLAYLGFYLPWMHKTLYRGTLTFAKFYLSKANHYIPISNAHRTNTDY